MLLLASKRAASSEDKSKILNSNGMHVYSSLSLSMINIYIYDKYLCVCVCVYSDLLHFSLNIY